ncbi:MAG: hypothetical protein RIQ33_2081 [Bacteroidota bacterium]|jgi:hypothetical protein
MLNLIALVQDSLSTENAEVVGNAATSFFNTNRFFNSTDFFELLGRYGFNFIVTFILVRLIYYPVNKRKEYLFTYFLFNTLIFIMCYMLASSKQSIGFAFGLFAVFSILRYRTEVVPIKEMAYFFICITLGVMNALATKKISYAELVFANALILIMTFVLDGWIWRNLTNENVKEIEYERIDLITPEKREEMLLDLKTRTGLAVHRIEIIKIDFLRDVARIKAYYLSKDSDNNSQKDDGDDD